MRALSENFMQALLDEGALLHALLERIRLDETLMLAIRDGAINLYYRGGNILKLEENDRGIYRASFDTHYNCAGGKIPDIPAFIEHVEDCMCWMDALPWLKQAMDAYFAKFGGSEREFQQLLARENNHSPISKQSEYFVSDIEVTCPYARFDLLAVRWPASQRKNGTGCRLALMEMKYGDNGLDGAAGLLKHLEDMQRMLSDEEGYTRLLRTLESQFAQLDRLGLLRYNAGKNPQAIRLDVRDKPELIFILANHNPRSAKLGNILSAPEFERYAEEARFDMRFFCASFAGYGMHADCMLTLDELRRRL